MFDPQQTSWSDHPSALKIPHHLYIQEKVYFAGILIGPILYGIIVVLFFKCMAALFDPAHRRGERTKWGLVSYTVLMFLVATVLVGMGIYTQSNSYIDNREFPGVGDVVAPGPLGYQSLTFSDTSMIIANSIFYLNGWLADGLLLYRCYIIYSMNLWAVALPCLMYLGTLVTSIVFQVTSRSKDASFNTVVSDFALPCLLISVSLNILLTLMITVRLILHARATRTIMGRAGIDGLCRAIVTMLIESCALYAMSSLLVIAPWVAGYHGMIVSVPVLSQTQVIAPLLIIQRVSNKSALTKNTVVMGCFSSFKGRVGGELTDSGGALPGEDSVGSADGYGISGSSELGVGVESTIDFHQDKT